MDALPLYPVDELAGNEYRINPVCDGIGPLAFARIDPDVAWNRPL